MRFKAIYLIIYSLLLISKASALEICGELKQGELVVIKGQDIERVEFYNNPNKKVYKAGPDGIVLAALHRDAPENMKILVTSVNGVKNIYSFSVLAARWDIQKVNGVAKHKVNPEPQHENEILREQHDVTKALGVLSDSDFWSRGFIEPVKGRISGYFGNQRIFNGVPKSPHSGTDIAAPEGTEVIAAGDGIVVLNGKNYFYTGNMVVIDHGQGLQTIYAHLQKSAVKEGDKVKQGDIIGFVGKTGRATGPHLHWGASLNNVRFRPHSLLNINTKDCKRIYD